jgi:hypothetical protein
MAVHRLIEPDEPVTPRRSSAPLVRGERSSFRGLLTFGCGLVLPWLLLSLAIPALDLPDYGAWTGIRPLEQKLRMLAAFAAAGEVDAVVLGSSVSDFGFSAQRLSQRLSRELGRPYRAFNFSTGAAEVADYPELYRLVRTVARPRSVVMIVCAATGPRSDQPRTEIPQTPVYYLSRAPAGSVLTSPRLLQASHRLWDLPPVRYAGALRDLIVFGSFQSLKGVGSDLYAVNENGDRISYLYESSGDTLARYREGIVNLRRASASDAQADDPYFSREDVQGLREMTRLTDADGCARIVVGHDKASHLVGGPPLPRRYVVYRRQYVQHAATLAAAPACVFLDDLELQRHAVADSIHLNDYGAAAFTDRAVTCWTGRASDPPRTYREPDLERKDPPLTFNTLAFLLRRDSPREREQLRMRFVRSIAVPALHDEPLLLALRQPDNTDLIRPARREGRDIMVAGEDLPRDSRLVFIGRLLTEVNGQYFALNQPLEGYGWESAPRH